MSETTIPNVKPSLRLIRPATKTAVNIREWKNTSEFPDEWAKPVVEWLCSRLNVPSIWIKVRGSKVNGGSGRAWVFNAKVSMTISRRKWRKEWQYSRHSWDNGGKSRPVASALEAFVFLAAHEVAHISPEGQRIYRTCMAESKERFKRDWVKRMEAKIQDMAQGLLEEYRDEKRIEFLRTYAKTVRKVAMKQRKVVEKKEKASTVDARIERIDRLVAGWERKARRAENAIRKLQRSRTAILAAQKRIAAAKR